MNSSQHKKIKLNIVKKFPSFFFFTSKTLNSRTPPFFGLFQTVFTQKCIVFLKLFLFHIANEFYFAAFRLFFATIIDFN